MKKSLNQMSFNNVRKVISIVIAVSMILTSFIPVFAIYPDDSGYFGNGKMYNNLIEYVVNNTGKFSIGTTYGNLTNPSDDFKKLLFGHPTPGTSFTTIKVDGVNNYFDAQAVVPDAQTLSTKATKVFSGVNVEQELRIVSNSNTNKADTVQIKYSITNADSVSHTVGTRIMMDVQLGNNDAAPFRIPGYGAVTTELELTGTNIPEYWMAFDSLVSPTVIGQGTLLRTENKPDKIQFTNWSRAANTMWDLTVNPAYPNGDSAVSIFWNPTTLKPNETKTFVTYYGLSEFVQDLAPPVGLTLNRVSSIEAKSSGYYPNPIKISGFVNNTGTATADNVKVKIKLPDGLKIVNDANELTNEYLIPIGSLGIGATRDFYWNVLLPEFQTATTLPFEVEMTADNSDTKSLTSTFNVPATLVSSSSLRHYEDTKYSIGSYNILMGTSTAISDPVDAANGNFILNSTDISINGFNPLSFSRFYNSVNNWESVLGRNWHNNFEIKLQKLSDEKVRIRFDDGRIEDFTKNPQGIYISMPDKYGTVEYISNQGYILTQKDKTKYSFDMQGNMTKIQNIAGNTVVLTYNSNKLVNVANDCGQLTFEYNGELLNKITDNTGRSVEFTYSDGNLTTFKDVEGNTTTYVYDSKNRLTIIIDPLGNAKITNVFDDKNRVTKQTMADGTINNMAFDDNTKTTTFIDRNGAQILYKWDAQYRIYETIYINGTEKSVFNEKSQKTKVTDKNGNTYNYEYDNAGNILKEIDALGQISTFTYDTNNKLTSITKPDGSIYTYTYDANGNMTVASDPLGRTLKMDYNTKGLPVKIILPDGSFSEIQYDAKGNATILKDPLGNASTFAYDILNRVVSITKPEGNKVEFEYTPKGKVKKTTFPDGTFTTTTYDTRDLVSEESDTNGAITKYTYNSMGKLIEEINPIGGITKYSYDSMWNVSKVILPDGSTTTYNYNLANQLESVTDAENHVTTMEHDALNNVTKVVDPKGGISKLSYDALSRLVEAVNANNASRKYQYRYDGKVTKVLDALNGATEYNYDSAGQLVSVKDALGNITNYTYNQLGLVESVKDAKGAQTKYQYNSNGKVTKVIKPDNTSDTFSYDKNNNLTKVIDPKGNTTQYIYDNMDRLTKVVNTKGGSKSVTYTNTGKVASVKDENNNTTNYRYDQLDRLIEVIDAKGNKTQYIFDAVGNLIEAHRFGGITQGTIDEMTFDKDKDKCKDNDKSKDKNCKDANYKDEKCVEPNYIASSTDIVTKYQFDRLGQVIKETNPANKIMVYSYDANGNLISKTDRDGFTTQFEYDAVNNLKKTVYSDGKKIEYQYDQLNQVIGMSDWLGNNTFELDSLGRVLKATNYKAQVLEYKWTPTGEKESIKYPDGSSVKYSYDSMGRLTKVNDGQNKNTSYKYDSASNVIEKLLPNGIKTKYTYDQLQRLTGMINFDPKGKEIDKYLYGYDATGNKINSIKNKEQREFEYDKINQLIEISEKGNTLEKYFYDTLGNRIRLETWDKDKFKEAIDYKYDNLDRLTKITGKGYNDKDDKKYPDGLLFDYDQRGNIIKTTSNNKVLNQYTFDSTNKLAIAINEKGEKSTFTYDGFDRRVGMTYDEKSSCLKAVELSYLHDVTKPYDNVLMISSNQKDEKSRQFTYGLEMLSMDRADYKGKTDRLYYLHDELGSPIKLVDPKGKIAESFEYDVFGVAIKPKNLENWDKKGNIFGFTGYQADAGTGLMYAQARYYMPDVGRFVSEDSYKGVIDETQSLNKYIYVYNNPINYIDPSGHFLSPITIVPPYNQTLTPPESHYGPLYNPNKWNSDKEIRYSTNCYAYALNLLSYPDGTPFDRAQFRLFDMFFKTDFGGIDPGVMYNSQEHLFPKKKGIYSNKKLSDDRSNIIEMIQLDAKVLGREFKVLSTANDPIPDKMYRVAVAYDPNGDYHFFRQDSNGKWSSKPGSWYARPEGLEPDFTRGGKYPVVKFFAIECNEFSLIKF